jgi:hypothetical protein
MSRVLYVRLSDEEHDYILRRAHMESRTITEIVRRMIETARQDTGNNSQITVDNGV